MNPLFYRQKLMNIAKNLKYSGNFFDPKVIQFIENIVNYCYNLQFKHSEYLRQKLDVIIVKYKLDVIKYNNNDLIIFTKIDKQFDLTILYKQLSDFLRKIQFFINLTNNIKQLENLFVMLDNELLDDISTIPMKNQSYQKIENYKQIIDDFFHTQMLISKIILKVEQAGQINNISGCSDNLDRIKSQTFLVEQIKQSDVKTLID